MKTKIKDSVSLQTKLTDDEIRDYAAHLYEQSGCIPGRDLDNWLDAKACLEAKIPKQDAHARLQRSGAR